MTRHPAARVLAVLELLQRRGRVSGGELAQQLGVDRRTVRRYIAELEEMGFPVVAERGAAGGYELVAGFKLPPLMFDEDEVIALALGLASVDASGWRVSRTAIASARAKLERVMPPRAALQMKSIVAAIDARRSFVRGTDPAIEDTGTVASGVLAALSVATANRSGVHLRYRDADRDLDPYGIAVVRGVWYVVGYCHLRRDLRSFRIDRIDALQPQQRSFARPRDFDIHDHLARSFALLPRRYSVEVVLATDLASARAALAPELGVLAAVDGGVLLRTEVDDLAWFARELARMKWRFSIRTPRALRTAVARRASQLHGDARRKTRSTLRT